MADASGPHLDLNRALYNLYGAEYLLTLSPSRLIQGAADILIFLPFFFQGAADILIFSPFNLI